MITDAHVERALDLVNRADIGDDLRRVLSPDGRGTPSPLRVETCLVGCLLAVQHMGSITYANVRRVLVHEISRKWQYELGSRYRHHKGNDNRERCITRRPIENMLNQIGLRLGHLPGSHPKLTDDERDRRANLLQSLMDRLLDASKPTDLAATGQYALDATGVWAWSRARDDGRDLDAEWGYKTAKSGEKEMFFGYDVYAFVRVQSVNDDTPYPHLVERLVVRPASSDEPDSTLPMIRAMTAGRYPIRTLIPDRAWSYKLPERWVDQLRDLGIEQVVDLHKNDHGVRDYEGLRIVAGWPHCPAMPDALIDIRRPPKLKLPDGTTVDDLPETKDDETETELATRAFIGQIEQRRAYATRRVSGPNERGDERHECPADAGQCRCPLKKLSMFLPAQLPKVANPPTAEDAPAICKQRTVTVPGTVTPKVRQRNYWGSIDWVRSFARRTHVEGAFGNLKNRNTENITRGWLQVSGHARTSLMLAIAGAAYNLRVARKWNADTEQSDDQLLQLDPPFHGWRELREDEIGEEAA